MVLILLAAFLATAFLIKLLKTFSLKHKILLSSGVPLIGGIGFGLVLIIISVSLFFKFNLFSWEIFGLVSSSFLMLIFGLIDDFKELSIKSKFSVQLIAASLLIIFGVKTQIVYIGVFANIIITYIWILGITNAFNHIDTVDGLTGGVALVIGLALFFIAVFSSNLAVIILLLALIGSVVSFLVYNLPPAKIYMGNCGSHFLGFILAGIALLISYASTGRILALVAPILIMGFPIFDTTFLIFRRICQGRSIFLKSDDHLALQLLKNGYSKKKTLAFVWILTLIYSLSAILASKIVNLANLILICFLFLISIFIIYKFGRGNFECRKKVS